MLELIEILAFQVIAAILGTLSIGGADWLYHRARIRQPVHALWVSSSSAAIPLPLLTWTINVFLGVGLIGWVLVSTFGATMFLWMYRNMLKVPPRKSFGPDKPPRADRAGRSRPRQASKTDWWSATLRVAEQSEGEDQQDTQPSDESPTITTIAERKESPSSATPTSRAGASP
jgi:hypothetical protein